MIYNFSLKDGKQSSVVTGLRLKSAFWYVYQGTVENIHTKEIFEARMRRYKFLMEFIHI